MTRARMPDANADALLTREQVAAWLQIAPREVERYGVPCYRLGKKTQRYRRADVLHWLESKRTPRAPRHR